MWATWLGPRRRAFPAAAGRGIRSRYEGVQSERSESALIGEHDRQLAVFGMLDIESHPLMALGFGAGRAQQQLTAHAQMGDERFGGAGRLRGDGSERNPEEFAAAGRTLQHSPGERGLELVSRSGMAGQCALVEHAHADHSGTGHCGIEPRADDLDLGQFRHVR